MKLKRKIPKSRTYDQVRNHYLVEKEIAEKLKNSDIEERKKIYKTMYSELFSKVPDHPRLIKRSDKSLTYKSIKTKERLIKNYISREKIIVEIAPGDCRFSIYLSEYFKFVYAIDISSQIGNVANKPKNFNLIIYNGFKLPIKKNTVDIVFSDQLIEHLHPEDTYLHLKEIRKILKQDGVYIFRTPHAYKGPSDISRYFSDEPEGFHLKEWTYTELLKLISKLNFKKVECFVDKKGKSLLIPTSLLKMIEYFLIFFKQPKRRLIANYILSDIHIEAVK